MSDRQNFEDRHIGPSASQESEMLSVLGYSDLKKFIGDVVPENIVIEKKLSEVLDSAKSEVEVIAELRAMADENEVFHITHWWWLLRNDYSTCHQAQRS